MNNGSISKPSNRTKGAFPFIHRYIWIITLLIALGGQFFPALGLLVVPIMAAMLSLSLFKGRYWCGNFCPHGSFFDNLLQPLSRQKKVPNFLRSRFLIAAVLIFFVFNMGRRFIRVYALLGSAAFYERLGFIFSNTYLMVVLIGGLLAVAITPRTWCHFCPMGTMQTFLYKLGKILGLNKESDTKVFIEDPSLCSACGKCARVCPMQLAPYREFSEDHYFKDDRCIRCYTCVYNCPAGILHIVSRKKGEELKEARGS